MRLNRRNCQTDLIKFHYDPLSAARTPLLQLTSCRTIDFLHDSPQSKHVYSETGLKQLRNVISKAANCKKVKQDPAILKNTKENQGFSFNELAPSRRIDFCSTPQFKKLLESPLTTFNSDFGVRLRRLKEQKVKIKFEKEKDMNNEQIITQFVESGSDDFPSLASIFKKRGLYSLARLFFKLSVYKYPFQSNHWLEWAKLEQDWGYFQRARELLRAGLLFTVNQALMLKLLRIQGPVSQVLQALKKSKVQKSWRVYLQIARLYRLRGQPKKADEIFNFLQKALQPNATITLQIAKRLIIDGKPEKASELILSNSQRGARSMGLFSLLLRLLASQGHAKQQLQSQLALAQKNMPKQIRPKLHLQYLPYLKEPKQVKALLATVIRSAACCKSISKLAEFTLLRPHKSSQRYMHQYSKSIYLHGGSQLVDLQDWKHCLHYSLFYYAGVKSAKEKLQQACKQHPQAGRILAQHLFLMRFQQISESKDSDGSLRYFSASIKEVPKSGQLWCEGGRIYFQRRELARAQFCFQTAISLTPQFADSYLQLLRLLTLKGQFLDIKRLRRKVQYNQPYYGNLWNFIRPERAALSVQIFDLARRSIDNDLCKHNLAFRGLRPMSYLALCCLSQYRNLLTKRTLNRQQRGKLLRSYQQLEHSQSGL